MRSTTSTLPTYRKGPDITEQVYSKKRAMERYNFHRSLGRDWRDPVVIVRVRRRPVGEWEKVK